MYRAGRGASRDIQEEPGLSGQGHARHNHPGAEEIIFVDRETRFRDDVLH